MTTNQLSREALERATSSLSFANYSAIVSGFVEKGILAEDVKPRENIFTFHAWKALGRHVRKGEHGVRITTWIPIPERKDAATGKVTRAAGKRPHSAVVFHISQTDSD